MFYTNFSVTAPGFLMFLQISTWYLILFYPSLEWLSCAVYTNIILQQYNSYIIVCCLVFAFPQIIAIFPAHRQFYASRRGKKTLKYYLGIKMKARTVVRRGEEGAL